MSFMGPFTSVLKDSLDDARGKRCDEIPVYAFFLETSVQARYIDVYIKSHFGSSGGLQYFGIVGEKMSNGKRQYLIINVMVEPTKHYNHVVNFRL